MNRRDFLAGLVCAVATLSLDVGGSTSLAITPPPEEVPTEPISENDLTGLKLDYVRRRRRRGRRRRHRHHRHHRHRRHYRRHRQRARRTWHRQARPEMSRSRERVRPSPVWRKP